MLTQECVFSSQARNSRASLEHLLSPSHAKLELESYSFGVAELDRRPVQLLPLPALLPLRRLQVLPVARPRAHRSQPRRRLQALAGTFLTLARPARVYVSASF